MTQINNMITSNLTLSMMKKMRSIIKNTNKDSNLSSLKEVVTEAVAAEVEVAAAKKNIFLKTELKAKVLIIIKGPILIITKRMAKEAKVIDQRTTNITKMRMAVAMANQEKIINVVEASVEAEVETVRSIMKISSTITNKEKEQQEVSELDINKIIKTSQLFLRIESSLNMPKTNKIPLQRQSFKSSLPIDLPPWATKLIESIYIS